ncbi:MAG: oligosaccharide flippase family protein [Dermatophilaceae bacterium]
MAQGDAQPDKGSTIQVTDGAKSTLTGVADSDDGEVLRRRLGSAALSNGANVLLTRFGNIAIMAVVLRIVTPSEFGVFTLAITIFAMVSTCMDLGVSTAVTRRDLDLDRIAPTVTTLAVAVAGTLALLLWVFAAPLAALLGTPDATAPLRVLCLPLVMAGFFAVPTAQLQRDFRQQTLLRANLYAFVPSNALLVLLAWHGNGALAFAWSRVLGHLIVGVVMVRALKRIYGFGFCMPEVGPLLRFGLPLAGSNLLGQLLLNVDFLFVGRWAGSAELGTYAIAFNTAMWSLALLGSVINGLAVPAFSKVRADGGDLPRALREGVSAVALVAAPVGFLTMALARPLITTLYGVERAGAVPVLQVLSVYGMVYILSLTLANVLPAVSRTGSLFTVQLAALAALAPAILIGLNLMGIVGVGVAHVVVACFVTLPAYLVAVLRVTGARVTDLARAIVRPLLAGVAAGVAAYIVGAALGNSLAQLLCGGLVGACVYVGCTWTLIERVSPWSPRLLIRRVDPRSRRRAMLPDTDLRAASAPTADA